jgi:hypothetical protein
MSAIKNYMATIAESKNRTSMLLNAWREISDRLDALEAKAHEHPDKVQPTDWTVVIKGDVPYRVASFVGPDDTERSCDEHTEKQMGSVNIPFQSPMPVEVPPPSTLYTGDTERSCDEPAQEQLWICPKAKDCPCNEHILEKPSCNHVVPHKKSRMCESASSVCPECIPYAQEQGGDDKDYDALLKKYQDLMAWYDNHSGTPCEQIRHEHEVADLRARLEQAERIARDNGELALRRGREIERLEKENAELKRKLSEVKP